MPKSRDVSQETPSQEVGHLWPEIESPDFSSPPCPGSPDGWTVVELEDTETGAQDKPEPGSPSVCLENLALSNEQEHEERDWTEREETICPVPDTEKLDRKQHPVSPGEQECGDVPVPKTPEPLAEDWMDQVAAMLTPPGYKGKRVTFKREDTFVIPNENSEN